MLWRKKSGYSDNEPQQLEAAWKDQVDQFDDLLWEFELVNKKVDTVQDGAGEGLVLQLCFFLPL